MDSGLTPHAMAANNGYVDADWFFPALSLAALATDSTLILSPVGQETHGGQQVTHLSLFHYPWGQPADAQSLVQGASKVDLYLDSTSLLPAFLDFNAYAASDPVTAAPTEIKFSAYQSFSGVQAPTRIQKSVQGSLVLDFTTTNVTVNSGVADIVFGLPVVPPAQ